MGNLALAYEDFLGRIGFFDGLLMILMACKASGIGRFR